MPTFPLPFSTSGLSAANAEKSAVNDLAVSSCARAEPGAGSRLSAMPIPAASRSRAASERFHACWDIEISIACGMHVRTGWNNCAASALDVRQSRAEPALSNGGMRVPRTVALNERSKRHRPDNRKDCAVHEGRLVTDAVPEQTAEDACEELQQTYEAGVPADAARPQMVGHEVGGERLAHRTEGSLEQAVPDEQDRDHHKAARCGEAGIAQEEHDERSEKEIAPPQPVRQQAGRVRRQRRHEIESRIDEHGVLNRGPGSLRGENQEGVAGIAQTEESDGAEIPPIAGWQLPPACIEAGLGDRRGFRLANKRYDENREQPRNDGEIEDFPHVEVENPEQKHGDQRPEESAEIVAKALEAKGFAAVGGRHGARNQGIAWRRTRPDADPVEEASPQNLGPEGRKADQRLGEGGEQEPRKGDGLGALQAIGKGPRQPLDDVLGRLREAVDKPDDAAVGTQHLCQKNRQDRIEHLRRDVAEQTRERQEQDIRRQPG